MENDLLKRMDWKKLLSTKRVEEYGICSTTPKTPSQYVDPRSPFEKDCDQLIFSYPFRRLQDKTQVIPFPEYDFVHTRLTHSLEVASVGRSFGKLVYDLIANEANSFLQENKIFASDIGALIAAACYAHDIGNPPFGHSGEASISFYFKDSEVLKPDFFFATNLQIDKELVTFRSQSNYGEELLLKSDYAEQQKMWQDLSSFEGNANGFRIITKNCEKGINPTSALLGTFTKYPRESFLLTNSTVNSKSQSKYGFFQEEKTIFKQLADELGLLPVENLDILDTAYRRHPLAFLMEASDDIAYGMIDFEDGCRLGLIDLYKKYDEIKIKDKLTGKIEDKTIDSSPMGILIDIAKYDNSFDEAKLKDLSNTKETISFLRSKVINIMIHKCFEVFNNNYDAIMKGQYDNSLIEDIDKEIYAKWKKMKLLVRKFVYNYKPVLESEASGFEVMYNLIESLGIASGICYSCNDVPDAKQSKLSSLLPEEYITEEVSEGILTYKEKYRRMLYVLDYVSGMTDNYAISLYRKIKGIALPNR